MTDNLLNYHACGAETGDDWLRMLANDNDFRFSLRSFRSTGASSCARPLDDASDQRSDA